MEKILIWVLYWLLNMDNLKLSSILCLKEQHLIILLNNLYTTLSFVKKWKKREKSGYKKLSTFGGSPFVMTCSIQADVGKGWHNLILFPIKN